MLYIVKDKRGNELLALIKGEEEQLINNPEYRPLTSSFVIIKSSKGFMLLKNRYRNEWELPGGMIDADETPRDCAIRECFEESGNTVTDLRFVGMLKFFLKPSHHLPEERIEYTALYCAYLDNIGAFVPNEEMAELYWYNGKDEIGDASAIDIKLLDYFEY